MASFFNHFRRQGNIACDHEVTNAKPFNDLIVGDIETGGYLKQCNAARRRYAQRLIGYKRHLHPGTLCRSE